MPNPDIILIMEEFSAMAFGDRTKNSATEARLNIDEIGSGGLIGYFGYFWRMEICRRSNVIGARVRYTKDLAIGKDAFVGNILCWLDRGR